MEWNWQARAMRSEAEWDESDRESALRHVDIRLYSRRPTSNSRFGICGIAHRRAVPYFRRDVHDPRLHGYAQAKL